MPDQLQLRGGTTAQNDAFTGAAREVTVDTTKNTLIVHNNTDAGGAPLLREDGANSELILGSAATPSLKFTGDTNTGIFSPGADQVAVSTGGTERVEFGASEVVFNDGGENYDFRVEGDTNQNLLFVDASSERIGMGTGSPSALLHISRTVNSGDVGLIIQNTGTSSNTASIYLNKGSGAEPDHRIQNDTGGNLTFARGTDESSYSEQMRIDSSGRLLVGTSSNFAAGTKAQFTTTAAQACSLVIERDNGDLVGNQPVSEIRFNSTSGGVSETNASISVAADAAQGSGDKPGRLVFSTTADGASSPTERMRITANGRIGIGGVADPQHRLHLNGDIRLDDASPRIEFHDNNAADTSAVTCGFEGYDQNGNRAVFVGATEGANTLSFGLGNQERVRIDSSGRLLVGTSTSTAVASTAAALIQTRFDGSFTNFAAIRESGPPVIVFGRANGDAAQIVSSGDELGTIRFAGADGTDLQTQAATISAFVDGTPGANDMPGRLEFYTTADGNSAPQMRMRITSSGAITWANSDAILESFNGFADARIRGTAAGCNIYVQSNGQTGVYQSGTGWVSASSARLKNVVGSVDSEQCWNFVKGVNLYRYYFKEDPQEGVPYFGPMAEEIGELDPEMLLETNQADEQGPIYSFNLPLMEMKAFAALQTALSRIEQLEAKVAALEAN